MRTILHVDLNNFYASVECLYNPALLLDRCGGIAMKYIEVTARFEAGTGKVIPVSFMWDGRLIKIDKVCDARPGASLKCGGQGMRYTCQAKGYTFYLFCDINRWFLEAIS